MNDQYEVYHNIERKRELVVMLRENLKWVLDASDALDKKAWDVLGVTTATFGIVSAIQIILKPQNASTFFWIALVITLVLYFAQVWQIVHAIQPRKWSQVPGTLDGKLSYEGLLRKFVPITEDEYLNQLIADYAGANAKNDPDKFNHGAIELAEKANQEKSLYIRRASWLLFGIILGLVGMAVAAVI